MTPFFAHPSKLHPPNREAVEMLLRHGADPDLEVDGSENLRDVIAANIDNFDFAAYADKVSDARKWIGKGKNI